MISPEGIRRTKIVCTIGPATDSADKVLELIEAGMDVARLNFSHGDRESHRQTIRLIRKVSQEAGRPQDTAGDSQRGRGPAQDRGGGEFAGR